MTTTEDAIQHEALKNSFYDNTLTDMQGKNEDEILIAMIGTVEAFSEIIGECCQFHESHEGVFAGKCSSYTMLDNLSASMLSTRWAALTAYLVRSVSKNYVNEHNIGETTE